MYKKQENYTESLQNNHFQQDRLITEEHLN